jgi:DNA invertase Pin-like site-specific DNA recombinase
MMSVKILEMHTKKPACIYIRQSTMGQIRNHRESTERQYALRNKAQTLGWPQSRIRIMDNDLGQSGAQSATREDFKTLVADVSMRRVGAIFALEVSRLARSNTDWHRLLELCAMTDTLIIDEDGCYDPSDFNDQLLLGLKGTMSQAELHFIRARLQGGKLNKAKKGKLRFPLPIGYCHDDGGRIVVDSDREVRGAVAMVFQVFAETGSAYGVVKQFATQGIKFPKRAYGGAWNGKLIWGRLGHGRVLTILRNPSYAGAYVYGRYQQEKTVSPGGIFSTKTIKVPISDWRVMIQDHHEAYIGWDVFCRHQTMLEKNQTNEEATLIGGPAREGLALLHGLLICGKCGRRISVRYKGNGGVYPTYECNWLRKEGVATASCLSVRCDILDTAASKRTLEVINPQQLEIAIKAVEQLEKRNESISNQWKMRIERAEYEASLAQRRYEEVDPSNRLVAATLENRWNEALLQLQQVKDNLSKAKRKDPAIVTPENRNQILALAKDLPRLWKSATTEAKDRKRILRLIIKDITVEKKQGQKELTLHVRWHGGACEDIPIALPLSISDRLRYSEEIVEEIRHMARDMSNRDIACALNKKGRRSAMGKSFTPSMISWIRYKHKIPAPTLKRPEEMTVKEASEKFKVSQHVIYYWIERGIVDVRRLNHGSPYWITINPQKETVLFERVKNSTKIHKTSILNKHSRTLL